LPGDDAVPDRIVDLAFEMSGITIEEDPGDGGLRCHGIV